MALTKSPVWQIIVVLLGAPAFQGLLFFVSGTDFETFTHYAFVSGLVMEYCLFALVLLFLRQRGFGLRDIGVASGRLGREILIGIGAGILLFALSGILFVVITKFVPSSISREPRPLWAALFYGFALMTAFAPIEEIVWRGYAIKFLDEHTNKRWLSVFIASLAFGLAHWWGGFANVVASSIIGILFSVLYLWRKNLVANITAHLIVDLPLFLFMLFPVALPR